MKIERFHFKTIDSTNAWGKQNFANFKSEMTLITAEEQTAGRGRYQRKWISPPQQNLYMTLCFSIPKENSYLANIPQILALAALEELEKNGFPASFKWPNDLLIADKKVAGILCEVIDSTAGWGVILGMGINVNMELETLQSIGRPATSLFVENGQKYSLEPLLNGVVENFCQKLILLQNSGFAPFLKKLIVKGHFKKGEKIRFKDHQKEWVGLFQAINPDGSLTLEVEGKPQTFFTGEFY